MSLDMMKMHEENLQDLELGPEEIRKAVADLAGRKDTEAFKAIVATVTTVGLIFMGMLAVSPLTLYSY